MAFISCNFHSDALGQAVSMNVILPQQTTAQIGMESVGCNKPPVLYLLHGLSDDHTIWMRRTSIERYVSTMGLAVVMPAVCRSFYNDMASGGRYWTFVSEELPALVKSFFNVSDRREDTFVAGLSMGGYGAFKLALRRPDVFAAAASLSGVTDVAKFASGYDRNFMVEAEWIFGDLSGISGSENDLFALSRKVAESDGLKPALFQCCGTEDFLYEDNVKFRDHMQKIGYSLHYQEAPGVHEWGFWDRYIQDVLQWLPIQR
jgi:S-formylglutathione hydrolase FrmB